MIEIRHYKHPQTIIFRSETARTTREALEEAIAAKVSLAGADLKGCDMRKLDRKGADFTDCDLTDVLED